MAFKYPPLPAADGLRILTLQPGDFWAPLIGVLTAVPFSEKPRYVALSYTWSDPDPDHAGIPAMPLKQEVSDQQGKSAEQSPPPPEPSKPPSPQAREESYIVLNGTSLPLFHNVCLALRFVRSKTHSVALWVDAICIDQSSILERNAQVALMAFIFTRATAVISWLGVPSRDELGAYAGEAVMYDYERLMAAAWEAGQVRHMAEELMEPPRRRTAAEGILTATTPGGMEKVRGGKLLLSNLALLERVVSNPYWSRLWVVQEVCIPRNLYFLFGAELFTEEVAQMKRKSAPMERLLEARRNRFSDAMRLETLIERFMESGCAEVRDRVFGLVGLANDVDSFALDIPEITSEPLLALDQTGRQSLARRPNLKMKAGSRDAGRSGPLTRADSHRDSDASVAGDTSDGLLGKRKVLPNKSMSTFGSLLGGGIATLAGGVAKKSARVANEDDQHGGLARGSPDTMRASSSSSSSRGRGLLEIDYRRTFYEIWSDVVSFVHFRAKPLTDLGQDELEDERSIRVVRFGGVLQKALQGRVDSERRDLESEELFDPNTNMILAKGYVAGKIVYMGPTYREFVGSYRDQQRWLGSWNTHYEGSAHLEMLRKMEEAYSAKILEYQDQDLARIRRLYSPQTKCWHAPGRDSPRGGVPLLPESDTDWDAPMGTSEHDPIRFLGTDLCMGLAPTAARVGDLVIRFWNCDAAIVVRRSQSIIERDRDAVYWLVGRADVAEAWDRRDGLDIAAQEKMRVVYRPEPTTKAVYVAMDFETLQKVSAAIEI